LHLGEGLGDELDLASPANPPTFLGDHIARELASPATLQRGAAYTGRSFVLASGKGFLVRANRVLPRVPYRQWVLTLPGELARVVAFDADLATAVFGVFADELARWQRERANNLGIAGPQTGSLLENQRFADGARLYPHVHALVPDGVSIASMDGQSARFIRQDPPSDEDVAHVVSRVEVSVQGEG
jgi:hypothetical protein